MVLAGCVAPTPGPGPTPDPVTNQTGSTGGDPSAGAIGPGGGTVSSADGRLSLAVPAGALAAPVVLTAAPASVDLGGNATSLAAYSFGPAGTQFAKPAKATLRLPTTAEQRAAGIPLAFPVVHDANGLHTLENVTLKLDGETLVATADVRHFSEIILYRLGASAEMAAPDEVPVRVPFEANAAIAVPDLSYREFNERLRGISYQERPVAPIVARGTLESYFSPPVAPGAPHRWTGLNEYECTTPGEGFLSYTIRLSVLLAFPDRGNVAGALDVDVGKPIRCRTDAVATGSTLIGPAGGSVASADGKATLVIPAGAVMEPTEMNVVGVDAPEPDGEIDPTAAYALQPEGLELAQPARLQIRSSGASPPALARPGADGLEPVDDVTSTIQSDLEEVVAETTAQRLGRFVVVGSSIRVETTALFPEYGVGAPIDVSTRVLHRDEGSFQASQEHLDGFAADVAPAYSDAPTGSVARRGPMGAFSAPRHLENVTAPTLETHAAAVLRCTTPGPGALQIDVRFALKLRDAAGNVLGFDNQRATFRSATRCVESRTVHTVGAAGGTFTAGEDPQVTLEIPAGAVGSVVSFVLGVTDDPRDPFLAPLGPFGPFAVPATLTIAGTVADAGLVPVPALPMPEGATLPPAGLETNAEGTTYTLDFLLPTWVVIEQSNVWSERGLEGTRVDYGVMFQHIPFDREHAVDEPFTLQLEFVAPGTTFDTESPIRDDAMRADVALAGPATLLTPFGAFAPGHNAAGWTRTGEATAKCTAPGTVDVQMTLHWAHYGVPKVPVAIRGTVRCVAAGPPATPGFERGGVAFTESSTSGLHVLPEDWGPFSSDGGIALVTLPTGWTAVDLGTGTALHTENFGPNSYNLATPVIASDGSGFIVTTGSFDWRLTPFSGDTFGTTEVHGNAGTFHPFGPDGGLLRHGSNSVNPVMLQALPEGVIGRTEITTDLPNGRSFVTAHPLSPTGPILLVARDPSDGDSSTTEKYFVWTSPGLDLSAAVKSAVEIGTSAGDLSCTAGACAIPDFGTQTTKVFTFAPDGTPVLTHTRAGTLGVRGAAAGDDRVAFFGPRFSTDEVSVLLVDGEGAAVGDFSLTASPACDAPRAVNVARDAGGAGWHVLVVACDGNDRIEISDPFRLDGLSGDDALFPPPAAE